MFKPKFQREVFDPANEQHVVIFARYLFDGYWPDACPFYVENPFIDAASTCKDKLLRYQLKQYK